jgi:heterodisulfide reductase subunit B
MANNVFTAAIERPVKYDRILRTAGASHETMRSRLKPAVGKDGHQQTDPTHVLSKLAGAGLS